MRPANNCQFWPHVVISTLDKPSAWYGPIVSEIANYLNKLDTTQESWCIVSTNYMSVDIRVYCKNETWLIPIKLRWGQ